MRVGFKHEQGRPLGLAQLAAPIFLAQSTFPGVPYLARFIFKTLVTKGIYVPKENSAARAFSAEP